MKTSVVVFVGFFLFGCVAAKPQTALNNAEKQISGIVKDVTDFNAEIVKTLRDDILAVLPVDEVKEYYQQLQKSPVGKAVTDLLNGNDLRKIIDRITESQAFKMFVDDYNKLMKSFEQVLNTLGSYAVNISPLSN